MNFTPEEMSDIHQPTEKPTVEGWYMTTADHNYQCYIPCIFRNGAWFYWEPDTEPARYQDRYWRGLKEEYKKPSLWNRFCFFVKGVI